MTPCELFNDNDRGEWAALYASGALSDAEKLSFEKHIKTGCGACASELAAFQAIFGDLAVAASAAPPANLRERLSARMQADSAASHADVPGILLQNVGLLISRSDEMPWQAVPVPGLSSKTLYVDASRKYATSLVRMEPGAIYPAHRHNDVEEVFLIEGDLLVEGVHMRRGDYCRSTPGSIHGAAKTRGGVLLLVFSSQNDELLA